MSTGYFSLISKGRIDYLYHYHQALEINIFHLPGSRLVSTPSQSPVITKKHLTLALYRKKRYYTIGFEIDNRIGKIQNKGRTNGDSMKKLIIPITFLLILSLTGTRNLHPLENPSISIIGPSLSKHFATSYSDFNYFHPGIGGEFQTSFKKWIFGFHGYYMFKDSLDHKAYWTGITAGYRFGSKQKLWCEPKKRNTTQGNSVSLLFPSSPSVITALDSMSATSPEYQTSPTPSSSSSSKSDSFH